MKFAFLTSLYFLLTSATIAQTISKSTMSHYPHIAKPQFPGCLDSFIKHNSRYPEAARENNIEGRVGILFTVTETGEITDIQCTRSSYNKALDKEAIRIIRKMPRWQPGYYKKRPIRVVYMLPITFWLDLKQLFNVKF